MKYSQVTAFLNLLSDSRLRKTLHASAFIEAPARRGFAIGERISAHINQVFDTRDRSRSTAPCRQKL
jgi:hypothetical protein